MPGIYAKVAHFSAFQIDTCWNSAAITLDCDICVCLDPIRSASDPDQGSSSCVGLMIGLGLRIMVELQLLLGGCSASSWRAIMIGQLGTGKRQA